MGRLPNNGRISAEDIWICTPDEGAAQGGGMGSEGFLPQQAVHNMAYAF